MNLISDIFENTEILYTVVAPHNRDQNRIPVTLAIPNIVWKYGIPKMDAPQNTYQNTIHEPCNPY